MITRMDRDIGRLVDLLASRGLDRNTVVLFTSDNGPHMEGGADPTFFNSSGGLRGVKRDLYEGGIRVPMIVRWPGTVPAGRTSTHPWAHWDMLPTFVDLAGGKVPGDIDGMSMARALRGESQPTHPYFYWEFHERGFQQAVRMGQLEGGALEARRAARALRSREGRARTAGRGRRARRYRQEDRGVPGDRADAVGAVAGRSRALVAGWQLPKLDQWPGSGREGPGVSRLGPDSPDSGPRLQLGPGSTSDRKLRTASRTS